MKLYEINQAIEAAIDMETGEIINPDLLADLQMERREKLANIALLAKNKAAEVKVLKEEEQSFKRRRMAAESTLQWCKETLERELAGETLRDDKQRFTVSYRNSKAVNLIDAKLIPEEFRKPVTESMLINKAAILDALKAGETVPGAEMIERKSIQIR